MCVGHFGHSKLSLPIYHIGYFKHLIVVLKMVCKYCFKVLLEESELKAYTQKMKKIEHNYIARSALFKKIFKEASKNLKCPHCQRVNPVIQKIAKVSGKIEVKHPML
jgi:DNA-directed RNA polymerase III subunit RPC1